MPQASQLGLLTGRPYIPAMDRDADPNFLRRAMLRGFLHRCPACGKGHLFRSYLKQVDHCASCGESFAEIRADDGPAWLTTLVIGHVVVALALISESSWPLPLPISITVFVLLGVALALAFLPRAKGI